MVGVSSVLEHSWIFKVSADGELEWELILSPGGVMEKVIALPDGNFIAAGEGNGVSLTKFNAAGDIIWDKQYGANFFQTLSSISLTKDDGILLVGGTFENSASDLRYDFWIVKIDAEGEEEWTSSYGGNESDIAMSGIQTTEGNYVVVGWADSDSTDLTHTTNGLIDAWVILLDDTGQLINKKMLGGSQIDRATEIVQLENGSFLIAGVTGSNDFDVTGHKGSLDVWVINLDENLNKIWDATYGGSSGDRLGELLYFSNSEVYMTGSTSSADGDFIDNTGGIVGWLAKFQVTSVSSTENPLSSRISVYPNPSVDFIHINGNSDVHSFVLIDSYGNRISSGLTDRPIDISKFHRGSYLLTLYNKDNELQYVERVIKME